MTIDYALQIARGETYIQTVDEIDYEREAKDVIFNAIRNGTLLKAQPMNMRDATEEERKSVKDYVDSVSKPTGVNFNELLRDCGTCKHNTGIDCGQYPCNECNRRTHPLYEPKIAQPTEAVSREQALLALTGMDLPTDRDKLIALFTERIQHLPPVTPQRPKGKWIKIPITLCHYPCDGCVKDKSRADDAWCSSCEFWRAEDFDYRCSECDKINSEVENYCPNCGAEMEVEE